MNDNSLQGIKLILEHSLNLIAINSHEHQEDGKQGITHNGEPYLTYAFGAADCDFNGCIIGLTQQLNATFSDWLSKTIDRAITLRRDESRGGTESPFNNSYITKIVWREKPQVTLFKESGKAQVTMRFLLTKEAIQ